MRRKTKTLKRKVEHIDICLRRNVEATSVETGFGDVTLIHEALPELSLENISLEAEFLNHRFKAPILVDAISGGPKKAFKINSSIAGAVEELKLGMIVGSQRIALEDEETAKTFRIVREKAPNAFISANIGVQQITDENGVKLAEKCVEMLEANALTIHLNPLQESLQLEGDKNFEGCLKAIEKVVKEISAPVIVKETGCGINPMLAKKLEEMGVAAVNVAGAGGTSWAAVEYYRNLRSKNRVLSWAAKTYWNWGIPTAFLTYAVSRTVKIPVISSGGIRNGLEIAKALILGACMGALAKPILFEAIKGEKNVEEFLNRLVYELKLSLLLTGSKNISEFKKKNYLVTGKLRELIESWRGGIQVEWGVKEETV